MPAKALPPTLIMTMVLLASGCGGDDGDEPKVSAETTVEATSERDRAIAAAEVAYADAVQTGQDLSSGPCIAEKLPGVPGWVADVAHDPRQPVDDDPANQCQSFATGEATHFVELTPGGELIQAE